MQGPNESERFRMPAAGRRLVSAHKAMLARNAVCCAARGITAAPNRFLINKSDKMEAGNPRKLRPQASEGNLAQRVSSRECAMSLFSRIGGRRRRADFLEERTNSRALRPLVVLHDSQRKTRGFIGGASR